ncbi:MAG: imidazole glycerol phosphate synthase subunit HisF [Firmicutes bacterium]|nr:imidazole glycerol phosphate synthase subunit HisF [Bacillota bacterium]
MFRPRIIPVLLVKGNGLVKTVKYSKPIYLGDPMNAVYIFNSFKVDEIVILDITASMENRTISTQFVKQIGDEAYMPFGVGGGISSVQEAIDLINAGAEKVILNTLFIKKPDEVYQIAKKLGNQSVVVSIDVKRNIFGKYYICYNSGSKKVKLDPIMAAKRAEDNGAGEILLNYIPFDGVMQGYNLDLIKIVSQNVNIPVIASCGAGSLNHMYQAYKAGASALAAGSFFVFYGAKRGILINYPSKIEINKLFNGL